MPCPAIHTGAQFLWTTLSSIDCHARNIGGYGYGALADPASPVSLALTALVTIFIALFGVRMLLGHAPGARDVVGDVIKIGLVLTIAASWPAWRTVVYDLVLDGPVEIARSIGLRAGLPESGNGLVKRLQDVDDGIVVVTMHGSGRLTGGVSAGADLGDAASGIALADATGLGMGRIAFLVSAVGGFSIVRLGAGVLLALAPLMAGLALFSQTLGLFIGWLRGLAFCALGSLMLLVMQGAMTAMMFPWLDDVVKLRQDNVLTPSAPTELLALTVGFAALTVGTLFLAAKLTFFSAGAARARQTAAPERLEQTPARASSAIAAPPAATPVSSRAQSVAEAVSSSMRRESRTEGARTTGTRLDIAQSTVSGDQRPTTVPPLLGDSFRRSNRRISVSAGKRNAAR